MSDHKHGSMDTSVQEKTFDGFLEIRHMGRSCLHWHSHFCSSRKRLISGNRAR